jgi:hypothetical protein
VELASSVQETTQSIVECVEMFNEAALATYAQDVSTLPAEKIPIVILVYDRINHLRDVLESFRHVADIHETSIIISHDRVYDEMSDMIRTVLTFCPYTEIYHPYAFHTLGPERTKGLLLSAKHHYWWVVHMFRAVLHPARLLGNPEGHVIVTEDDHLAAWDLYLMAKRMATAKHAFCGPPENGGCFSVILGHRHFPAPAHTAITSGVVAEGGFKFARTTYTDTLRGGETTMELKGAFSTYWGVHGHVAPMLWNTSFTAMQQVGADTYCKSTLTSDSCIGEMMRRGQVSSRNLRLAYGRTAPVLGKCGQGTGAVQCVDAAVSVAGTEQATLYLAHLKQLVEGVEYSDVEIHSPGPFVVPTALSASKQKDLKAALMAKHPNDVELCLSVGSEAQERPTPNSNGNRMMTPGSSGVFQAPDQTAALHGECMAESHVKIGSMKGLHKIQAVLEMAVKAVQLGGKGDFVEAGVAGGGGTFPVLYYLACMGELEGRAYHLFDTWTGIPAPVAKEDKGFRKGQWNVGLKEFWSNFQKWGVHWDQHRAGKSTKTWKEIGEHLHTHVGLFGDTMPVALRSTTVVALYCDGDMYQSSMDCLESAERSLHPSAWIYHDDYFTFLGNYKAVENWKRNANDIGRIALIPNPQPTGCSVDCGYVELLEDENDCIPPKTNKGGKVYVGTCQMTGGPMQMQACFWQHAAG